MTSRERSADGSDPVGDPAGAVDPRVHPFRVEVPDEVLADLGERLARVRWPDQIPGSGWTYGTDLDYLRSLCDTWRTGFDWRAQEARFNRWPHVVTEIDGQPVHSIVARSAEPTAMPLLLVHGWPGSVAEFLDVIDPLVDPVAHGGRPEDAFHVVAPSIPGYGFSGPTAEPGWDVLRVAHAFAELMTRLGFDRFGAQGGDWGSMIASQLGSAHPDRVIGVHLNMVIGMPVEGELSEEEQAGLAATTDFMENGSAYQQIQGRNPQTLGYGLSDSPAGLAGWIVEKFHHWTHHPDGDLETAVSRDQLLTNLTVYWVTNTINSSTRLYYESRVSGRFPPFDRVEVPVGCAMFPGELVRMPRSWAEALFNVTHWSTFDRGGHFAAMEQPEALVGDIRAFFATLR